MRSRLPKVLKAVAVLIGVAWLVAFFLFAPSILKIVPRWYSVIAGLNNFTFIVMAGVPLLLVLAPFGLFIEWLGNKADQIEQREVEAARRRRPQTDDVSPPRSREKGD